MRGLALVAASRRILHSPRLLLHQRSFPAIAVANKRFLNTMAYTVETRGSPNTDNYRVFFRDTSGNVVSPFHDIPLYHNKEHTVFNMVVEVPRWTNAKMEIDTKAAMNPIKQDSKKGKLRYVHNCFPHHGYIWNYGCLPQTWEDPKHKDVHTGYMGDNDPIDACEIGQKVHKQGAVIQVKVLGILAMIDEGETDWKVMCIDVNDPMAKDLNDVQDIQTHMPGFLRATHEWFKIYKMPGGSKPNEFAFNGEVKDKKFALEIIADTHKQWQGLLSKTANETEGLSCDNVSVCSCSYKVPHAEANSVPEKYAVRGAPAPLPDDVDKWHYVKV